MSDKDREQVSGIIHIGSSFVAPSGSRKEKTLHTVEKKREEDAKRERIRKLPVNPEPDMVPPQIQEILDKIAENEIEEKEREEQEDLEELHNLAIEVVEGDVDHDLPIKRSFTFKLFKAGEINSAYLSSILEKTLGRAVTADIHPLSFGDMDESFNYMSLTRAAKGQPQTNFDPFNQAKLPDSWFSSEKVIPIPEAVVNKEQEKEGEEKNEGVTEKEESLEDQVARALERRRTLEQYWSFVKENPYDFSGWCHLLEHVETMRDINITRGVYNAFLPLYPYCFAYWKRYSDLERKNGNDTRAVEVLERGLEAVPSSNDLWLSLVTLTLEIYKGNSGQEEYVRWRYEQAISTAGHLFTADAIWESYINWEIMANRLDKATALFRRAIKVPTRLYNKHFDNFIAHVRDNHPIDILGQREYEKRRELACKRIGMKYKETFHFPRDDRDPSQLKRKMDKPESKLIAAMKEKLVADVLGPHREVEKEVDVIWNFEDKIRRSYFHVKPLDKRQLKNWQEYLDFEISRGQYSKIITLFERCLVACANYEEFWAKYANFVEKWIGRNPAKEERVKIKQEKVDENPSENNVPESVQVASSSETDPTRITEKELEKQSGDMEIENQTVTVVDLTTEQVRSEQDNLVTVENSTVKAVSLSDKIPPTTGVGDFTTPAAPPFVTTPTPDSTNQGQEDDGRCTNEQVTNHVLGSGGDEDLEKFDITAESVRNVFRRGCLIHCPKKPRIRLLWSLFEEEQGNYDWSRNLIQQVVDQYPSLLEARSQLIEMELRLKNHERVIQLYEYHLMHAWGFSKAMGSWLSMKYARYQFKVKQNPEKALQTLRAALKKDRSNPSVYQHLIDLCYQRQPIDAKGVRAAFTLALLSKDMKVTDKIRFARKKMEFARDFGDIRSYRESMEQLVYYQKLAEKDIPEQPEVVTVAASGKVIDKAGHLCSGCGGSAKVQPAQDGSGVPPQQMDSGMMQYFYWLQAWYRQFYGEGSQNGNAFNPPNLPNYGTYGYGDTDFTQLPLYQQEQLEEAEAAAMSAAEPLKPEYNEVPPTESINMSIPQHLKKDPNFQEWEMDKFKKYAALEAKGWPKDHTTVIHVTIHDTMPVPPQKPLPMRRKKGWFKPRFRPADFPDNFKLRMIDQMAISGVQYLDLAGVDRIYPGAPVGYRQYENQDRLSLYYQQEEGPQPLFPQDPSRYKWFNPSVYKRRRNRWEKKSESGDEYGEGKTEQGNGREDTGFSGDHGNASEVSADDVVSLSEEEQGKEIEVILTKRDPSSGARKRRSSELNCQSEVLKKLPKTGARPRPGLGLLPNPKFTPQDPQGMLHLQRRPPGSFNQVLSTLVEARKHGNNLDTMHQLPNLPQPLFPGMAQGAGPDALGLPLCDELAQNVAPLAYSPCVNAPDWFLSTGGELVLSQRPDGFSTIRFMPRFLTEQGIHLVYGSLRKSQRWVQRNPSLVAWLGPCDYESSSLKLTRCENWPVPVCDIIYRLITDTSRQWNSCMVHLFRSGYDWSPWCDEPVAAAGKNPSVALVLLGPMRIIELQKRHGRKDFIRFPLFPGSALILDGITLSEWTWQIPRDPAAVGEQMLLVFQVLYSNQE